MAGAGWGEAELWVAGADTLPREGECKLLRDTEAEVEDLVALVAHVGDVDVGVVVVEAGEVVVAEGKVYPA